MRLLVRGALACATLVAGIKLVGVGYIHLCLAGSRTIECVGAVGVPLAAGAAVWLCRRHRVGLAIALGLLLLDYLAREPYLRWVHGPHSPWRGFK